jgi:hypothetical protein
MTRRLLAGALIAYATAHAAVVAAPAQDRPGFPTEAHVWIDNRRAEDAVPVSLTHRPGDRPQQVEVVGMPVVTLPATTVVQTRSAPLRWEYRAIAVTPAQDVAAALQEPGRDGWELTGVQLATPNGTTLLLKRQR